MELSIFFQKCYYYRVVFIEISQQLLLFRNDKFCRDLRNTITLLQTPFKFDVNYCLWPGEKKCDVLSKGYKFDPHNTFKHLCVEGNDAS